MKTYLGMYLGIVVQNNDPEYRGRVKVYVPHIQANVYESWYKELKDKSFNFPGKNIKSDLNKILPELKTILPWADNAMPMIGGGSGRYNAYEEIGTISDSNRYETLKPHSHETTVEKKYNLNSEHIGEKPGKIYESHNLWVNDAFTNTENPDQPGDDLTGGADELPLFDELPMGERLNGVNRPNKYAHNYRPTTYSNCAKGSFSIPNVGAHVWVFFEGGNPLQPVVFGVSHGQEDWKGIYDCHGEYEPEHGMDYPGTYENISKAEEEVYDNNTETYRNKYVINQKGGSLEFINTDNREILKMTHYSGSFKEFNNHTNIEFAARNNQRLVQEDEYDTVKGFRNIYTERDLDYIVRGDFYRKIGYQNFNYHLLWRENMRALAETKSLFEVCRVTGNPGYGVSGSIPQEQKPIGPGFIKCPVCHDTGRISYHKLYNKFKIPQKPLATDTSFSWNGASNATIHNNQSGWNNPIGRFPSSSSSAQDRPIQYTFPNRSAGFGVETNPYQSAEQHGGGGGYIFGEKCPVCNNGSGIAGSSPSTMEGSWELEELKSDAKFEEAIKLATEALAPIESNLGLGGSEIITTAKHKVENIGLVMNDYRSIRTDPVGKMYRDKMVVHKQGVLTSQKPTPLIENVHVDDLPGGTYSLNVSNRWNVHVGAGGISMKTYGRVEVAGTQVNVAGEQVNIGSQNEVNIDGGKRLSIVSDIISIRQRNRGQVLVDSDLGVSQNVVIGGGLHVEGELSCHHLTAPVEIHETELVKLYSKLLSGLTFKCNIKGGSHSVSPHGTAHPSWTNGTLTLVSDSNDDHCIAYDHSHLFKAPAMHLVENSDLVRTRGKECNDTETPERAKSHPVEVVSATKKVKSTI